MALLTLAIALGACRMEQVTPTQRVWEEPVTTLSYRMFPPPVYTVEYAFGSRVYKKAVSRVGGVPAPWKERVLTAAEHDALVALLRSLQLKKRVDAPPLPPGGSQSYTLKGAGGDRTLAVYGEGTFFELTEAQDQELQRLFVQLIPDSDWE